MVVTKISISKSTERKAGAVLSYTQIAIGIIGSLLYTPLLIRLLGQNEYGLYGTVYSAVGLVNILDMGFTSSYIKFYTKYKSENRYDKINSFNSLFTIVFLALAVIAAVILLVMSFNLDWVFDQGLTALEYEKARKMILMLTLSMFAGFATTVFGCYINANEKFVFSRVSSIIISVATMLITIAVLYFGAGVVGVVAVSVIFTLIGKFIFIWYCKKDLHIRFDFKNIDKNVFKQVFSFSFFIAINIIVDKINQGIDSVLLGRFCGTAVVAVYTVGGSLNSHFTTFSTAISGVFTPRVHQIVTSYKMDSKEQRAALTEFFVKVGRIQYLLMALIASGIVFFGKPFIYFWAGDGYDESYYIALIMILPSIVPLTQNVGIEIQRAENRHHYRSYIYGAMAIVNLIVSIYLCQIWGGIGSAIGTGLACVIANIIIMNIVYHKKINIDVTQYWKNILRQTVGMIIPFIAGALIMNFVKIDSILKLLVFIIIYTAVYCVFVYLFSMNNYERSFVKGIISKGKKIIKK